MSNPQTQFPKSIYMVTVVIVDMEVMVVAEDGVVKDGIHIKIPRDALTESVADQVKDFLKKNQTEAYTVMGMMVELFGARPKDMNGAWATWPKGLSNTYNKVRRSLDQLIKTGLVDKKKKGKAFYYLWK
jgi:hypothetical protein